MHVEWNETVLLIRRRPTYLPSLLLIPTFKARDPDI
jgi:hypothetical protein